ncbi:MAG: hypothetical protein FJX59_04155 [Alphaproteobacteria bacterium]|nr:hypothetical protein [Alphaproteobacteria bacterium]
MLTGGRLFIVALILTAASTSIAAEGDDQLMPGTFTANVALTNDYVFRGYTQNQEDFAVQGGFDWDSGIGVYVGAWASNYQFGIPGEGSFEGDVYGGYKGTVDNFTYDVGAIWYLYPGTVKALEYEWWEASVKLGYDFGPAAVSGSISYTPDYFGGLDKSWYYAGKLAVPVGVEGLTVDGTIGRQDFRQGGLDDVTDYSVGITYAMKWFTTDLRYIDTNGASADCKRICDGRVVMKLSRSF